MYTAHCLSGFPEVVSSRQGVPQDRSQTITRLFPNLKFGCFGTIVRFSAAVRNTKHRWRDPMIQIWRKDSTRPGLYHRISSKIRIQSENPPCYQRAFNVSSRIFQCTLREDFRISVQPGDFLGLEIPSSGNDDLVIYFKAGGLTSLVFQDRLGPTVNLFTSTPTISNDEPQITFLVALGKEFLY